MLRRSAPLAAAVLIASCASPPVPAPPPSFPGREPPFRARWTGADRPCHTDDPCCRTVYPKRVCYAGCPPPPPTPLKRVEPDLASVVRPYPCGGTILELISDEAGRVVSSCVLLSARPDFDLAAQRATRQWRWSVKYLHDEPVAISISVALAAPGGACRRR